LAADPRFFLNLKEISEDLCGLQKSHAAILLSKFSISVQTDGQCMRARLSVSVLYTTAANSYADGFRPSV
jgi:hypothetical protein